MTLVSQNKQNLKTKVTLLIREDARNVARKNKLNMSSILENALLNGLFPVSESVLSPNLNHNVEIPPERVSFSTMKEENERVKCARSMFNPSESEDEDMVILPISAVEMLINSDFSTFTVSKRKLLICHILQQYLYRDDKKHNCTMFGENILRINDISSYMSMGNMQFKPMYELPMIQQQLPKVIFLDELFKQHKEEFIGWARLTVKTEQTLNMYVKILESFSTISRPNDIIFYEQRTKLEFTNWKYRALSKFFTFLNDMNESEEDVSINGYSLTMFRKKLSEATRNKKLNPTVSKKKIAAHKTVKDGKNLTDSDILEQYQKMPEELKPIFKIMVYSGVRCAQLLRLLSSKYKVIEDMGTYIKVSAQDVQLGTRKKFEYLYAPKECMKYIQKFNMKSLRTQDTKRQYTYENVLKKFKSNLSSGRRITAKGLRKYNVNFLITNCGVDVRYADFVQSRTDNSVRSASYENVEGYTDKAYEKSVKMFLELLPF